MTLSKILSSQYVKFVPALIVFAGFVVTEEVQLLTFAVAFTVWPTLRSLRED